MLLKSIEIVREQLHRTLSSKIKIKSKKDNEGRKERQPSAIFCSGRHDIGDVKPTCNSRILFLGREITTHDID